MNPSLKKTLFSEVNPTVCEALRELMKDEIAQALAEEREKTTREITQKVTAEITQKVTAEVTQKVTAEITQKVTREVTQATTKKHILSMRAMNFTDEVIAQILNLPLTDVKAISST